MDDLTINELLSLLKLHDHDWEIWKAIARELVSRL